MTRQLTPAVRGDRYGLGLPAHPGALLDAGTAFLTGAFHAAGTLAADNAVTAITEFREVEGGSTGRKALLSVRYRRPEPHLHTDLFVKFSRDFDDPLRDRGRTQMAPEVRFAELARTPGFPVAVPAAQFGDYHRESGTGLLISERIGFGANGIEPQYHKCLDYEMPDAYGHYRALLTAVARLAGAHRAGRLPDHLTDGFPGEEQVAAVGQQPPAPHRLPRRLERLAEFCRAFPGLLPEQVRDERFLARFADEARAFQERGDAIHRFLRADLGYSALCHWNANVDNAWFWRDGDELRCGLMDWGCVSRMNVAMALWGALSGAEDELWERHLDALLELFVTELHRAGGPRLDTARLTDHLMLYIGIMGVTWLLDVPALFLSRFGPSDDALTRTDPRISAEEGVRGPLRMLTTVLTLWHAHDFGARLRAVPA